MKASLVGAGGFGISPSFLSENLRAGDEYSASLTLMRGEGGEAIAIEAVVSPASLGKWISFGAREDLIFNENELFKTINIKIKIPDRTFNDQYNGLIIFSAKRENKQGTVKIALGAATTLKLKVSGGRDKLPINEEYDVTNLNMYNKLKGNVLIKVEDHGALFYVHPQKKKIYSIKNREEAEGLIVSQGSGITRDDLNLIKFGFFKEEELTSYEEARWTDLAFAKKNSGRIFLEDNKEDNVWYVYPKDNKRYRLGLVEDERGFFGKFAFGVSNNDFEMMIKK